MGKRRATDALIIHTSATRASMDIGRAEIDRWHRDRGFLGIGYHYVIRRDGTVETGRPEDAAGAHCRDQGMNHRSIGVCMVGGLDENGRPESNYTPEQWATLERLTTEIVKRNPSIAVICGHRDVKGVAKECPCFDVREWLIESGPRMELPVSILPKGRGSVT